MDTTKNSAYKAVIGLEIHAELKTKSKMFCPCPNNPDEERPNVNICPICLGHPGTLPVLNHEAITHVLRMGVAVSGSLADFTEWDRKNYFYPDIPKGYQISQYKYPLVSGGTLAGVEIERIHLEEDTAQSTHDTHEKSLVNFNRSGVPLMELVTKPVIHDSETAVRFAKELQLLLRYLHAGEANMEKGEMRVEANISVGKKEDVDKGKFGTKTEVKNLNSFRAVERAIAFEIDRQIKMIENREKVVQETRGWDDNSGKTFSQRSKESSHDYRYFPDPDIPKMKISEIPEFAIDSLRKNIPELPSAKRARYEKDFGMTAKEIAVFVDSPALSSYFESIITNYPNDKKLIKLSVNYLLTDMLGILKKKGADFLSNDTSSNASSYEEIIPKKSFGELITMASSGDLSSRGAKDLLAILIDEKDKSVSPRALAEKHSLIQKSDAGDLSPIIDSVIASNEKAVLEYRSGKQASIQYLIGQAMKATKGSANPELLRKLLAEKLA